MECRMGHLNFAPAAMMGFGGIVGALHKVALDLGGKIAEELSHEGFRNLIADLPVMVLPMGFNVELLSVVGQIYDVGNAGAQTNQQGTQRIDLKA